MSKEYFSLEELETLRALQAKQKRVQRANKAEERFMKEVDRRKADILARWHSASHTSDMKWYDIIDIFGATDEEDLYNFLTSDKTIRIYREKHLGGVRGSTAPLILEEPNTSGAPADSIRLL